VFTDETGKEHSHVLRGLRGSAVKRYQSSDYTRRVKRVAALVVGLASAALVLGGERLFAVVSPEGLSPFDLAEIRTYDWRLTHTARPETARKDIALVEIDEPSLRSLQPNAGRWPWPRAVHSMLLDYLSRAPAKVIAYDVVFSEADTRVGFDFGGSTISGAESDRMLADSLRAAGNVILVADASYDADAENTSLPDSGFPLDVPGVYELRGVLPPVEPLADAASGLGHNRFVLDPDGPLRHLIPFVRTHHHVVPSLGVSAALRVAGIRPQDVRLDGTVMRAGDREMPLSWRHVKAEDGIVSFLWNPIDFRGPARLEDLKSRTYPTYSFFDLLYSEEQILAKQPPKIDPSVFRDKIVFVGVTATGLFDVFETPFSNGKMPGVQIHAAAADDMLSGRFIRQAGTGVRVVTVTAAAVAIGLAATFLPAWWATAVTALFLVVVSWTATSMFRNGYWLNLSQPVLASSVALFGGVAYQYFFEGREKRKMKKLFGQYVSKDVCDQLVANPSLARLGGNRREMTVLFSDIRSFTAVSEHAQPEAIVGMLNEYFTRMVEIVFAHHGTLDKFVGDMVMALFGAPLDDSRHADHAVEAALDMIDALEVLNARWLAAGRPALDIGIGINTGPMIAGNIGSNAIMSYTVIGDAVNLGSRLESLNKQYGTRIIISEATRKQLSCACEIKSLGDVVVKGKTEPVAIFEVAGRRVQQEARL
jgi:adenylate cyclase